MNRRRNKNQGNKHQESRQGSRQESKVRIIAGTHGSRQIRFPQIEGLRPTSNRIRETLFNWLQGDIPNASCLDLYAGSGALGFEAMSRGAGSVQFVEISSQAIDALQRNQNLLNLSAIEITCGSVTNWLAARTESAGNGKQFDIVFVDPPYSSDLLIATCKQMAEAQLLNTGAKIYLEHNEPITLNALPASFKNLKQNKAGSVHYYLFENENQAE